MVKILKVNFRHKNSLSYEIHIGYNIFNRIPEYLKQNGLAKRYVIITDDCVANIYGKEFNHLLNQAGFKSDLIVFSSGEENKNIHTVIDVSHQLLELGIDRTSALIALGGGVVGDLTGFIASIYMRGIPWIQIPTTLLAQVDSSIGGKTGVDLDKGKNLIGSFHQPCCVFIDISCLKSLSDYEYRNGLAEVVKYGLIEGESFFRLIEKNIIDILNRSVPILEKVIEVSCLIKKRIIEKDEKENSIRKILNLGHTLGHALEFASDYRLSHGNAISIGMIAACQLSEQICGFKKLYIERTKSLISAIGLDCSIPRNIETERIISSLKMDKKKQDSTLNFILLEKIGSPVVSNKVSNDMIRKVIKNLRA